MISGEAGLTERRCSKSPYSGDLVKPLPRRKRRGYWETPEPDAEWDAEFARKFHLLLDHYGLDQNDSELWPNLALSLIDDHVPGLQEASTAIRSNGFGPPADHTSPD